MYQLLASLGARQRVAIALIAALAATAFTIQLAGSASAATKHHRGKHRGHITTQTGSATGLGQLSGLLPRNKLTEESAIQVNLNNDTVRLPIYPGDAPVPGNPGHTERVWYVLLDASDQGLAHDLGVNYAPKLANIGIGDPAAVQTVTEDNPSPQANPFGPAVVHFQGAPDFSPTRTAVPGPTGFPLKSFSPGSVASDGYSPFIRIAGSDVVYSAPIVATGDEIVPGAAIGMFAARKDFLAKNRDVVIRFAMAYLHAAKEFNAAAMAPDQHQDIVEILAKLTALQKPELVRAIAPHWSYTNEDGVPNVKSVMAQQDYWSDYFHLVEKKVPESQLFDLSIAREAKARLDREKPFGN